MSNLMLTFLIYPSRNASVLTKNVIDEKITHNVHMVGN